MTGATEQIHASCIAIDGHGVLLLGPSGSGKSDLSLRLILGRYLFAGLGTSVALVADDRVDISHHVHDGATHLRAAAPEALSGLIEVRGIGILRMEAVRDVEVRLAVRLADHRARIRRMPDPDRSMSILDVAMPQVTLYAHDASAPHKVVAALAAVVIEGCRA